MRITPVNTSPTRARGGYVLYWMIGARRTAWSFALDRAICHANAFGRPLLVLEAVRCDYRWASDRMHAFIVQGMVDNAKACARAGVTYLPYIEPSVGAGSGLLAALARQACAVVTDEQPGFFLPAMVAAAAARLDVLVEQVDGNGLVPLRAFGGTFATAMAWRRAFQKIAREHLVTRPSARPFAKLAHRDAEVPAAVLRRWTFGTDVDLATLPIDHGVPPVGYRGGITAARTTLRTFVRDKLARYADEHSDPDADVTSGLSPYLHFGHIATHEIVARVWDATDWDVSQLATRVTGKRAGWWRLPASAEAFLDELVTWRELGFGFCFHRADHARWSAVPKWARDTLTAHASDPRPVLYRRAQLDAAATGDPLWNAAQRQLRADGRIQNYLRMLWGKKILEWSPSPRAALATLIELNNRYAVDGRDPNSYTGILWVLGLFDRPWGPRRPIFGTVRYMSSENTARKLNVKRYLARWSG